MQSFSTKCLGLRLHPFSVQYQCPLSSVSSRSYSSKDSKTHYEELGLPENATTAEIKKAFISKSKELHPDVNPLDPDLHKAFVKISAAYNTLSNPTSRRNYDMKLNSYSAPSSSYSYSAGSPFGTRNASHYYNNHNRWHESNKFHRTPVRQTPLRNPYNKYVVAGVLVFMFTGAVVHYVIFSFRHQKYKAHVEEASRKANLAYAESKERARSNGVRKQLDLLMALHAQPASSTLQHVSEVSNDSEKNT
ncbi:dnaJ homolog subfamily C member 4-like [Actinia tenebrosa]|uniref:DnaJ homolog subfamily C member 4-like n=1 Tax=Actinia tenebrosa TaxID=6105 RepID=A0A6P8J7R8_ACTTE|nr:dnaJ homolog subfamily C member 4-like [Actinia tenebrosa]XP_031573141.1 dnaJ homolog subfamily C member 4-like [Actinia tenebrosa]